MTKLAKEVVSAKLIALTQPVAGLPISGPEGLIAYCARVSSSRDKEERGEDYEGLLRYCIKHKHWSVFEMANAVVEVNAPRDISRQLLRHRSFSFQEFSQRYSDDIEFCERSYRRQDTTNRQNSIDNLSQYEQELCQDRISLAASLNSNAYHSMIEMGVAKECARVILPEGLTMSTLYMQGSLRSFIHYLDVRDDPGVTQHEHVQLARAIKEVLLPAFPSVFGAITSET